MDSDSDLKPASSPRKVKFTPKVPKTRKKPLAPKKEFDGADDYGEDSEIREALLRKVNEHLAGRRPQAGKKSPVEVEFTQSAVNASWDILSLPPTTSTDGIVKNEQSVAGALSKQKKRAYKEPWDYNHSYYPITLPLRRPYSGDPEVLDKEEFGEAGSVPDYDESSIHSASDLGLMKVDTGVRMLLFQLPTNLPFGQRPTSAASKAASGIFKLSGHDSAGLHSQERAGAYSTPGTVALPNGNGTVASSKANGIVPSSKGQRKGKEICGTTFMVPSNVKGKEIVDKSISSTGIKLATESQSLELPAGHMGKLLVYKSGKVKLKLGDILYDVTPGSDYVFAQDVVAINSMERDCSVLGELTKRAVVTPDVDSLLRSL